MKSLCVFGVGDFAGPSAWKGLTFPTLCTISLACFNILTFCSVSSCRPLFNKIGFTRFGASTQKIFSFRDCCFHCWPEVPVPGPVLPLGASGAQFRSHCRLFFPGTGTVSSPEIWTGSRTGSTGPPEVPVTVAVLPLSTSGGNFRRHFRLCF